MTKAEKLELCRGCRDDFYNGKNDIGVKECWLLEKANAVKRWRQGWWADPLAPGTFVEVETLDCHNEPGKYAFNKDLPSHAREPRRLAVRS